MFSECTFFKLVLPLSSHISIMDNCRLVDTFLACDVEKLNFGCWIRLGFFLSVRFLNNIFPLWCGHFPFTWWSTVYIFFNVSFSFPFEFWKAILLKIQRTIRWRFEYRMCLLMHEVVGIFYWLCGLACCIHLFADSLEVERSNEFAGWGYFQI